MIAVGSGRWAVSRQEAGAGADGRWQEERFSISHLSVVIWHFGMEDVRNAGFKFEVQRNIQQERLCVVLLLLTPGFSQVNEDTQLILKPFRTVFHFCLPYSHLAEARC
jgi:hypothetical protein